MKKKMFEHKINSFEFFLHTSLKSEIILTRIGQDYEMKSCPLIGLVGRVFANGPGDLE